MTIRLRLPPNARRFQAIAPKPDWLDPWLEPLLRRAEALPVEVSERSGAEQHRIALLLSAICAVVLLALLNGVVFGVGVSNVPLDEILQITIGVPVVVTALLYGMLYWMFVARRRDDGDHPWKFRASTGGLRVERVDGRVHEGDWPRWRFESYTYMTIKAQRGVTGLNLSLDGAKIYVDFKRLKGRARLPRAIVQQLAAHGGV